MNTIDSPIYIHCSLAFLDLNQLEIYKIINEGNVDFNTIGNDIVVIAKDGVCSNLSRQNLVKDILHLAALSAKEISELQINHEINKLVSVLRYRLSTISVFNKRLFSISYVGTDTQVMEFR